MKGLGFVLIAFLTVIVVANWSKPPFREGDVVTPKKDVTLNWAPPGVNDLLGIEEDDQPIFHEKEIGVIKRGGDLNDFVHRDPLFIWRWWCRVDIGALAQWCQCDNLKLYHPGG